MVYSSWTKCHALKEACLVVGLVVLPVCDIDDLSDGFCRFISRACEISASRNPSISIVKAHHRFSKKAHA